MSTIPSRFFRGVATGALVCGAVLASTGSPVSAAEVDVDIQTLTISPGAGNVQADITASLQATVPNSATEGDTTTITLPPEVQENQLPASIDLLAGDGSVVGVAVFSGADPAIVTITYTSYVDSNVNVGLALNFTFTLDDDTPGGTTVPLTFAEADGTEWSSDFDVRVTTGNFDTVKSSIWVDNQDQCRTDIDGPADDGCIRWDIRSRVGPWNSIVIEDTVGSGSALRCDTLSFLFADENATGGLDGNFSNASANVTVDSCTPTGFTVTFVNVPADRKAVVRVRADATSTAPDGGRQFENVVNANYDSGAFIDTDTATPRSQSVGGNAFGDNVSIVKADIDGNDANTIGESVTLVDGSTQIVLTITNTGTSDLDNVVVDDVVTVGSGETEALTCDFSEALVGAPTTGTTWVDGPFPSGESFTCTMNLVNVAPGTQHTNVASVDALGVDSDAPVEDSDPYNADRPAVSVGDFVFVDVNGDGLQDAGDTPIEGVTLTLFGPDGSELGTTMTDADGLYSFDDLPVLEAGESYTVEVMAPAGFVPTVAEVDPVTGSSTGSAVSGDLVNDGDRDPTLDFGFVPAPEPTMPPVPPPTTTPSIPPPTTTPGGVLPATGSDGVGSTLGVGGIILVLGAALIFIVRRRDDDQSLTA